MIPPIILHLLNQAKNNLPVRKTTSKINYDLYLLYLEDGSYYIGYSNNFVRRLKEHQKIRKNVKCGVVLTSLKSKANIKLLETYLIMNIKLFHKNFILANKRSEANQY